MIDAAVRSSMHTVQSLQLERVIPLMNRLTWSYTTACIDTIKPCTLPDYFEAGGTWHGEALDGSRDQNGRYQIQEDALIDGFGPDVNSLTRQVNAALVGRMSIVQLPSSNPRGCTPHGHPGEGFLRRDAIAPINRSLSWTATGRAGELDGMPSREEVIRREQP